MFIKKLIASVLCFVYLFMDIPLGYSYQRHLAGKSLFKLWEEKGVDLDAGLLIEKRLRAIHKLILGGEQNPAKLQHVDEKTANNPSFLGKYPFNYTVLCFKHKGQRFYAITADIYKDKYGRKQIILFYNPDNPPYAILRKAPFRVRTKEDREFARRGYWVGSLETKEKTEQWLMAVVIALFVGVYGCVFDSRGIDFPPGDAGLDGIVELDAGTSDTGEFGDNQVKDATTGYLQVTKGCPSSITIFGSSVFSSLAGVQRLYPDERFVCNNNAAFVYTKGTMPKWSVGTTDSTAILKTGLTYVFNGCQHQVIIEDVNGEKYYFTSPPQAGVTYREPYHAHIRALNFSAQIKEITFVNLEPAREFILNGPERQYAIVATTPATATTSKITPEWTPFSSGAVVTATQTSGGVTVKFVNMTVGSSTDNAGIDIPAQNNAFQDPHLQGAWPMDGSILGGDSSKNGNTLTPTGGVKQIPGKYGNAVELTTVGSYLGSSSTTGLNGGTSQQTITAWIKTNGADGSIAGKWNNANRGYLLGLRAGKVEYYHGDTLGRTIESNIVVNDGNWHHVAVVANGTDIKLYIDGKLDKTATSTSATAGSNTKTPFMVGNNGNYDWQLIGTVDEVIVFTRALTQTEIQNMPATQHRVIDSSDFSTPGNLNPLQFNVKGDTAFILEFTDTKAQKVRILILGLNVGGFKGIIAKVADIAKLVNPAFNPKAIKKARAIVEGFFLPGTPGTKKSGTIEIQGLTGIPPVTRLMHAADYYDPDMTRGDYEYLVNQLDRAEVKKEIVGRVSVSYVTKWDGVLTEDGLGFGVNGKEYSAFTINGCPIMPDSEMIMEKVLIEDEEIKVKLTQTLERRQEIILGHELDEIGGLNHETAVLNELEKYAINGLNYADIATVLFRVLIGRKITEIDMPFHSLFIAELLKQSLLVDYDTYSKILAETLGSLAISKADFEGIISTEQTGEPLASV